MAAISRVLLGVTTFDIGMTVFGHLLRHLFAAFPFKGSLKFTFLIYLGIFEEEPHQRQGHASNKIVGKLNKRYYLQF